MQWHFVSSLLCYFIFLENCCYCILQTFQSMTDWKLKKKNNTLVHCHRSFVKHWFERLLMEMKESDHWKLAYVNILRKQLMSDHIYFSF